jgi:hypothetical protein
MHGMIAFIPSGSTDSTMARRSSTMLIPTLLELVLSLVLAHSPYPSYCLSMRLLPSLANRAPI